jgi:hypothetical protein
MTLGSVEKASAVAAVGPLNPDDQNGEYRQQDYGEKPDTREYQKRARHCRHLPFA